MKQKCLVVALIGFGLVALNMFAPLSAMCLSPTMFGNVSAQQNIAAGVKPGWLTDYRKSLETASGEKKAVLLDFTGSDWCVWCIRLRKEVFETAKFSKYSSNNLVLVESDFQNRKSQSDESRKQNRELQEQLGIEGVPTIVVLNSEGKPLGRINYVPGGPQPLIEKMESIIKGK